MKDGANRGGEQNPSTAPTEKAIVGTSIDESAHGEPSDSPCLTSVAEVDREAK